MKPTILFLSFVLFSFPFFSIFSQEGKNYTEPSDKNDEEEERVEKENRVILNPFVMNGLRFSHRGLNGLNVDLGRQNHLIEGFKRMDIEIQKELEEASIFEDGMTRVDRLHLRGASQGYNLTGGERAVLDVEDQNQARDRYVAVGAGCGKKIDLSTVLNLGKNTAGTLSLMGGVEAEYREYDKALPQTIVYQRYLHPSLRTRDVAAHPIRSESDALIRSYLEIAYESPEILNTTLGLQARYAPNLNRIDRSVENDYRAQCSASLHCRFNEAWGMDLGLNYTSNLNPKNGAISSDDESYNSVDFAIVREF